VTRDEAKKILLVHRHGRLDVDPHTVTALALAAGDPELSGWLERYRARQQLLQQTIRDIAAPEGLKEQIISEQAARERTTLQGPNFVLVTATALILLIAVWTTLFFLHRRSEDTLAIYQNQMIGVALRGYAMDLMTNDPATIRTYLAQSRAPANFVLPGALKRVALVGCAVEGWQGGKVSMICFRTAKSEAAGGPIDLWLFVADRDSVRSAPAGATPQFSKINRLTTATWSRDGEIYLLGTEGDEQALKQYL
jgi:hypothetical protein